jgi:hypothetical protein
VVVAAGKGLSPGLTKLGLLRNGGSKRAAFQKAAAF